jgi:hypothetical protein
MKDARHQDKSLIREINDLLYAMGKSPYSWRAVSAWRKGKCIPRPEVVEAISQISQGAVTYQDHVEAVKKDGFRTKPFPTGAA